MTSEQQERALIVLRAIQADVADIKAEMARFGARLRRLDEMYVAFRTDHQDA